LHAATAIHSGADPTEIAVSKPATEACPNTGSELVSDPPSTIHRATSVDPFHDA
jgi:hypothetical protein